MYLDVTHEVFRIDWAMGRERRQGRAAPEPEGTIKPPVTEPDGEIHPTEFEKRHEIEKCVEVGASVLGVLDEIIQQADLGIVQCEASSC